MSSATISTTSSNRMALGPVSNTALNIAHNKQKSKSFAGFTTSHPQKTSLSLSSFNISSNSLSSPSSAKRSASLDEFNQSNTKRQQLLETSPRLERARVLKLKLQLAYYKVKTDQTNVPLGKLKVSEESSRLQEQHLPQISSPLRNRTQPSSAIADLLAASTPLLTNRQKKKKSLKLKSTKITTSTKTSSLKATSTTKRQGVSFLDDVVRKKGTRENLKRASLEFLKQVPDLQYPLSAPASTTSFSFDLPNTGLNGKSLVAQLSSQTSPSRFVSSSIIDDKHKKQLPPIPKFVTSSEPSTAITQKDAISLKTLPSSTSSSQNKNILQLPTEASSFSNTETSDATIIESTQTNITAMTPIRQLATKNLVSSHMKEVDNATDAENGDVDETQIMLSPTRLMSTPSSIGAARCLLQLAHR